MKKWMISIWQRKPSPATSKSIHFAVSKDEWDTKEDTSKSMKNVCQKVPLRLKRHQTEKPVSLAVTE